MNKYIERYFDKIELKLLQSPNIIEFSILSKAILYTEGKIRIKIKLKNKDAAELFEYVTEKSGKLYTTKYSFHWQNEIGNLIRRWDNAPHYKELLNFPNHIHLPSDKIIPDFSFPNLMMIISEIENEMNKIT